MTDKILGRKDFVERDGYLCFDSELRVDGHLTIEGNLGWLKFKFGVYAEKSISIEAGSGIKAGEGIEAGSGIKAGSGIEAGWGIEAGEGIEAGSGIEAGEGIEAGSGIKAGWGIVSFYGGLAAKFVAAMRIAVGFNRSNDDEQEIAAEVQKGDVLLGKVVAPRPAEKRELYWHIHHQQLIERQSEPIQNRIDYIKSDKPKHEVELRLKLLHRVEDQKLAAKLMMNNDHEGMMELHKKECPNCPWDGHTIFPEKEVA